ncbi:MAG TPA: phosphoribosyltransferase family protein, partial [bacterium]|nr:phosphoribosyltransferase family protein [bacterium]
AWIWLDRPHYLTPDDRIAEEAFSVIRDAMAATGTVGISRLVLYRRERAVMLEPRGKGIVVWTLRYGDEVREAEDYFAGIDTEKPDAGALKLIGRLIAFNLIHRKMTIENAIVETQSQLKGAFSSIVIYRDQMFAFRDPHAYRPYILGHLQGVSETGEYSSNGVVLASESCAFGIVGAKMIRELEPGEIIKLEKDKPMKTIAVNSKNKQHCVFELIYFSRPDTIVYEEKVYAVRKKIGARLAEYDKELGFGEDTVVMAVPDSSNFVALGYAHGSGLQFDMGLLRNHYVGRTFTKPDQKQRDEGVRHKFNPLPEFFKGKKVVLVDDSIVRGTTLRKIVRMIRSAGAKEVHVRIGSPRVIGSCYYGIDTPTRKELIAAIKNNDEICQFLEAESLRYIEVTDFEKILKNSDNFCFACFNLKYEYKPEDFHQKVNSPDKRC